MKREFNPLLVQPILVTLTLSHEVAQSTKGQRQNPVISARQWDVLDIGFDADDFSDQPVDAELSDTHSSMPTLDRKRVAVSAEPAVQGRNGGVVLDPEKRRNFQCENGRTSYPNAFECDWLFALDAENPDDLPVTRKFIDSFAKNGFRTGSTSSPRPSGHPICTA